MDIPKSPWRNPPEPDPILNDYGLIEAELAAQLGHALRGR